GGTRPVVSVYISDWVKAPDMLTFWMSLMPVASSLASFVGPLLGGIVVQADTSEPLNSAYVGFVLNFAGFLFVFFYADKSPRDVSENLSPSKLVAIIRGESGEKTPVKGEENDSESMRTPGPLVEWSGIIPFIMACGFVNMGTQGWSVLLVTMQQDIGFSSLAMGLISGWCGVWIMVGQLAFLPFAVNRLHWTMATLMVFGFAISTCIIVPPFAENIWVICAVGAIFSGGLPLANLGAFTMFPRLCDVAVKRRVMGLTSVCSNISKCVSILLCGVLYDVEKWIPYAMLLAVMILGVITGLVQTRLLPQALDHRRRMNLAIAAARTSRSRNNKSDLWLKRGLNDRFAFDALEEQRYYYLAPFGAVTVADMGELLELSKKGRDRMPRLCFPSKAVIIPDIMKFHLGCWTTKMLDAHGYLNWDACPKEIEMLLENGFPSIEGGAGSSSDARLIAFYNVELAHEAACKAHNGDGSASSCPVPDWISKAVFKLRQKPAEVPLPGRRLEFGRKLSDFLVRHGHINWAGQFEKGLLYHVLLRSTFPPLKPDAQRALRSMAVLASGTSGDDRDPYQRLVLRRNLVEEMVADFIGGFKGDYVEAIEAEFC
ncbi:hypothetical protein FOZ61_001690, partial [Perkinsus olseni]